MLLVKIQTGINDAFTTDKNKITHDIPVPDIYANKVPKVAPSSSCFIFSNLKN